MKNYTIISFFLILVSCSSIRNNVYTTLDDKDFDHLIILSLQDSTFTARVPDIASSSLDAGFSCISSGKYFLKKDTLFLVSVISRNNVNYKREDRASPLGKLSDFVKKLNNDPTIPEGYIKISIDISDYNIIDMIDRISFFYTDKETLGGTELNRSDVLQQDFIADRKIKTDTIDLLLPHKTGNFFTMTIGSMKQDRYIAFTLDLDDFQTNSVLFNSDILMRRDYEGIFYDLTGDRYIIKNGNLIPSPNNSLWHRKMINIQLNKTPQKRIPKSGYYLY